MTPQPQAVFLDMDGTILDWRNGADASWLESCAAHCDGSYVADELLAAIQARRDWFWSDAERAREGRLDLDEASRTIVRLAFEELGLAPSALTRRIAEYYRALRTKGIAPYPGAIETLEAFRARGLRMALLTNGEARNQRRSVEQHGLAPYFDCIVIEGEFGVGKPDERVFRHALDALSAQPESTWMVGDNLWADIAPAVALGLHTVWIDETGVGLPDGAPAEPHRIVRALSELVA